jgi:hypothetical protein
LTSGFSLLRRRFGPPIRRCHTALAAGIAAGQRVLQQIFGSIDGRHLAILNTLIAAIADASGEPEGPS